jgi:uncharacterized RDD family membrane protein YckC
MPEHELSAIPRDARALQGRRAGVVTRALAAGVDAAIVGVTLVGLYLGYAGLIFLLDPRTFSWPDTQLFRSVLVAAALMFLYLTAAWAVSGRTYGNLLMGLRVVGAFGGDVGWPRAALRAAAYIVFPIGLLWVAIDRRDRSLQDRLLATAVVHDWRPRSRRPLVAG